MIINRICILGGSGFVGRTLANRLTQDGYELRILTRNRERNRHKLILLPNTHLVQANVHDPAELREQIRDCDAVINLVGILNERGRDGSGFQHAHVELTQKLLDACAAHGVRRLLQMSALNADANYGPSHYLKTRGEAEDRAHATSSPRFHVTSFRPSVIFGRDDSFFNRFAKLLQLTPLIFPLACAQSRFAPVYVNDVSEACARALKDPTSHGQRYNLCGPRTYTLQELVEYTAQCCRLRRQVIPLNDLLSRLQAAVFDFVPGKPFSTDNYLSATIDSVCHQGNDLARLGITPVALETIVPKYLQE